MKKVAVTTLGCKVNQFESASFITGFREQGCEIVPASQAADIFVINTCTVTHRADAVLAKEALMSRGKRSIATDGGAGPNWREKYQALGDVTAIYRPDSLYENTGPDSLRPRK